MLKIIKGGGGGGGNPLDHWEYTPLYEKGIKKTENKSMETTAISQIINIKFPF